MAYVNIPGVKADYLDGNLSIPSTGTQPRLMLLGSAASGLSLQPWIVNNVRRTENEFGADTDMLRGVHEAIAEGLGNLAVMRIGGKPSSLVITDSASATLTIKPELRDAESLERYALVMDGSGSENRILVWDLENEEWVYDSSETLVLDEGLVEVTDTGIDRFSLGTIGDPTTYTSLKDLATGDFTAEGDETISSVVESLGSDGISMSLVEKYAALNTAYHLLDYKDADAVIPVGVHIDSPNVTDSGATANFWKGVPVAGAANDELGYVWQYIYKGKIYTYFVDRADYFSASDAAATRTVNTTLVLTAQKTGVGGNGISIVIDAGGAAGPTATISEPTATTLLISVEDDGTATTAQAATAINNALAAYTTTTGVLASTLVQASGGVTTLINVASTALTGGTGGAVLTPLQLTGDSIPSAVSTAFSNGTDSQLREVNFAHQLSSFLWRASTTWKAMIGMIPTLGPSGLSYSNVADWIGTPPNYVLGPDGSQYIIDATADNGSGVLGMKLVAGLAASGNGYRNGAIVDAASATDGLAYGGLILTKGQSLPNGDTFPDHAYGISSSDERLDDNRKPVDIGKHVGCFYDYPIHRNGFNGGSSYRGPGHIAYMAKLLTMPENEEPIGNNGVFSSVTSLPRIHATQLDQLAQQRMIGLRREEGIGIIATSGKTLAHPSSDWTNFSTVRCANRILQGLRRIGRNYIGKPFTPVKLIAMQDAFNRLLEAERAEGVHQGAKVALSYTKAQKILGRLNIDLKFVPPGSIHTITVKTSLASEEADL